MKIASRFIVESPPLGSNILVALILFPVDDGVPEEDDVAWAVSRLHRNRARGPSGMRAKYLWSWIQV